MDNQTKDNTTQEPRQAADIITGPQDLTHEPIPAPKPSQAEGDRDTIDQDIREKESKGEL